MAEGTTAADDELFSATPVKEGYPFVELKRLHHSNMVKEKKNP